MDLVNDLRTRLRTDLLASGYAEPGGGATVTGDFLVVESASTRKRPRGRAPKGCTWDYDTNQWVADATEIKLHGISIEDAGKNIVRVDLHAPKKKRILWHMKEGVTN